MSSKTVSEGKTSLHQLIPGAHYGNEGLRLVDHFTVIIESDMSIKNLRGLIMETGGIDQILVEQVQDRLQDIDIPAFIFQVGQEDVGSAYQRVYFGQIIILGFQSLEFFLVSRFKVGRRRLAICSRLGLGSRRRRSC